MSAAPLLELDVLPLAITRSGDESGCVGALTANGAWIRPEPLRAADLERSDSVFNYDRRVLLRLAPSSASDARTEDHHLHATPSAGNPVDVRERMDAIVRNLDRDVDSGFASRRSLGVVRATLHRLYVKRSTGGRVFVRAEFRDTADERYDWIVPDLEVVRRVRPRDPDSAERAAMLSARLIGRDLYFTIGLTKPNGAFPGKFRGCHPLVVGVHTDPDYRGAA